MVRCHKYDKIYLIKHFKTLKINFGFAEHTYENSKSMPSLRD